ncbi:MAG: hypothetical protein JXD18_10180 [Anaerolineae bacterium]|nr:hypothetical protein [Anaerolineae bacterium]
MALAPDNVATAALFEMQGWPLATQPGQPGLPYTTTLIVLPPTSKVTLTTRILSETTRLLPAPLGIEPSSEAPLLWVPPGLPSAGVTLTELGRLRGLRLARLTFVPLDYDPATLRLTQIHAITATLQFTMPLDASPLSTSPLSAALQPLVVNPELLARYPQFESQIAAAEHATTASPQAQLRLEERGLYALSWSGLEVSGVVTSTADPAYVRMHRPATGSEVALQWDAAGQRFLFYADPLPTRWADHEVYRVSYGTAPGERMETRTAPPPQPSGTVWSTVQREAQRSYDSRYRSPRDGDHWYWSCLEHPSGGVCPASASYTMSLQPPLTTHLTATLTLWLQGYTSAAPNPDHRVAVAWNDGALGEVTWEGPAYVTATLDVPATLLQSGNNSLQLTLPGLAGVSVEGVWLDAFALDYPIVGTTSSSIIFSGEPTPHAYTLTGLPQTTLIYDVTDIDAPVILPPSWPVTDAEGGAHSYLALHPEAVRDVPPLEPVASLTEPPGADYLVLAPQALIASLAPLLDLHTARGLTTFVAPVEAIYDQYGDGRMDPAALRAFVAHTYATWTPQPAYLLLVGDGTWDPLDHLGTGTLTLLPPYLALADPWLGEIASDNGYVTVDGSDALPDLAVGRLTVNDSAELDVVVAKLVTYATAPLPGDWNTRHIFVADDPDPASNFPAEAEQVTALVPLTHTTTRIYCTNAPDDVYACGNLPDVRTDLLQGWNDGALVLNWIGHSSFQQWEHGRLFHTDDLPALFPLSRYPLVLSISCFTGNFVHPDPLQTGMDESLLRLSNAGAVGVYGSSGMGVGSDHSPLHQAFYQIALGDNPAPPGVAGSVAKAVVVGGAGAYLADSYHFFGDPALSLHWEVQPWAAHIYLPLMVRYRE